MTSSDAELNITRVVKFPGDDSNWIIEYETGGSNFSFDIRDAYGIYYSLVESFHYCPSSRKTAIPQMIHLACIVGYLTGADNTSTIGDKGVVHGLIHLMVFEDEPICDVNEIFTKWDMFVGDGLNALVEKDYGTDFRI